MQVIIAHAVPGRVRLRLPDLRGRLGEMHAVKQALACLPGMRSVQTNPHAGSLLLAFDPRISLTGLLDRIGQLRRHRRMLAEVAVTQEDCSDGCIDQPSPRATQGLSPLEVKQRLQYYGPNVLPARTVPPFWHRLWGEFSDLTTLILLAGTALSALTGRGQEVLAVGAVTLLNAVIGAMRGGKEDQALTALHALTPPHATVVRAGRTLEVPAAGLVPGDLVLLEAGDRVAADMMVMRAANLEVENRHLLGNDGVALPPLHDQRMLRAGTEILRGRAEAVVVATGSRTELGRIAHTLGQLERRPSAVQRRITRLAHVLLKVAGAVLGIVTGVGLLRGMPALELLQRGVAIAAAAVPEGLPTFITLALAAGARRLARRGTYVRDLAAAEGAGNVDMICTDKTGTLTRGEMTVRQTFVGGTWYTITGNGFEPKGEFLRDGRPIEPLLDPDLRTFLEVAARCNNATLVEDDEDTLEVSGSQTEGALLVMALKAGIPREIGQEPRLAEESFDPTRRRMAMTVGVGHQRLTCSKGAPEEILRLCTRTLSGGEIRPLDAPSRRTIQAAIQSLAVGGRRVLALSYAGDDAEQGLIFAGLAGIVDPTRRELRPLIRQGEAAGIRTIMLTGDHPDTAAAVAHDLGLLDRKREIVTGSEISRLSDRQIQRIVPRTAVFARVTPDQKARIIRAMQLRGHTVAYIGDGVDDVSAIRTADIGAVPRDGSADAAREAAAIILTGDRLPALVTAIEQGRTTSANVDEIARYLLTTNTAEILTMLAAAVVGVPLPLLPLPLLWLNLIGDGPAALALGERHTPPTVGISARRLQETNSLARDILTHGVEMGVATFGLYLSTLAGGAPLPVARTMALTALGAGQILYLFRCRTDMGTPCGLRLPNDTAVGLAATASGLLLLATLHFPPLAGALGTVPLTMRQWLGVLGTALAGNLSAVAAFSLRGAAASPAIA